MTKGSTCHLASALGKSILSLNLSQQNNSKERSISKSLLQRPPVSGTHWPESMGQKAGDGGLTCPCGKGKEVLLEWINSIHLILVGWLISLPPLTAWNYLQQPCCNRRNPWKWCRNLFGPLVKGQEIKMGTILWKRYWTGTFSAVWDELYDAIAGCTPLLCLTLVQTFKSVL